jgi:hypothetical protein
MKNKHIHFTRSATMNPRIAINLKPLSRRAVLATLLSMTFPLYAEIVNPDTGEHWHPTMEENGESEPAPTWVIEGTEAQIEPTLPPGTSTSSWDEEWIDTDFVRLTDRGIDFGGEEFALGEPVGFGRVVWSIVGGFYTPRLIGTLHLNGVSGQYARMHISYWDSVGEYIDTRHGGIVRAFDNGHHSWSVDLSPLNPSQITEVHVCTEISNDGINFSHVKCTTKHYGG